MVALLTLLSTSATLLLASTRVPADPTPANTIRALLVRQLSPVETDDTPSSCLPICDPVSRRLSNCTTASCICNDSIIEEAGTCFSCIAGVEESGLDVKTAQGVIDELVSACKAAGTPVKSTTVSTSGAIRLRAVGCGALVAVALGAVFSLA